MKFSRLVKWIKIPFFLLCLEPFADLVWKGFHRQLTANPVEYIRNNTGFWTLVFFCTTLAISPLRQVLQRNELIRFRRMVGLFAFFYSMLHFVTYIWFEQSLDFGAMMDDVARRPFITMGFISFVLMIPLAVTSTAGMVRRLGGKRWQWLHRLVYASAIAGVVHYFWKVKSDLTIPMRFAVVLGILLLYRVIRAVMKSARRPAKQALPN
jgi:sulfoxide reductase heme-binding subunit YedZ